MEKIIFLSWEESERDWGTRPDGCSLHIHKKDVETFVNEYWAKQPDEVPESYSRPAGKPVEAYVTKDIYERTRLSNKGIRILENEENELLSDKRLVYGTETSGWIRK
jgi:hypothetical protein